MSIKVKDREIAVLLSEKALAKIWNTKEEDEAWKDLVKDAHPFPD